jgi:hypothetical protein
MISLHIKADFKILKELVLKNKSRNFDDYKKKFKMSGEIDSV